MFLATLNDQQKKAFLAIAMKIIGADFHLDIRERQMIQMMRFEMGLFSEIDIPKGSIEELAKVFDTRQTKSIAMIESIAVAYSDEKYVKNEFKILRAMALTFGISEEEANDMEKWVLDYKALMKQSEKFFSE